MKKRLISGFLVLLLCVFLPLNALAGHDPAMEREVLEQSIDRILRNLAATIETGAAVNEPLEYSFSLTDAETESDDYPFRLAVSYAFTLSDMLFCIESVSTHTSMRSDGSGIWQCKATVLYTLADGLDNPKLYKLAAETAAAAPDTRGRLAYLNQWLCDNVEYDDADRDNGSLDLLFDGGLAVCEGYARAVSAVCFLLDIPCVQLNSDMHTWNCVYVDGAWKMLDATWNDSTRRTERYFLVDRIDDADHDSSATDDTGLTDLAKQYALTMADRWAKYRPAAEEPEQPDSWAVKEVNAAIAAGLVPAELQRGYTDDVTRARVAEMFVRMIETASGKTIETILAEKGVTIDRSVFTDTDDANVLAMNALGIINGVGGGKFNPDGVLTREQIAAIINRVARVLGHDTSGYSASFTDTVGRWVNDELGWPVAHGVILGMGDNTFAPDNHLSTEQAILIVYRAYIALRG